MTFQLDEYFEQLKRYGGEPDIRIEEIIGVLTEINDDIMHLRDYHLIREKVQKIEKLLGSIRADPSLQIPQGRE